MPQSEPSTPAAKPGCAGGQPCTCHPPATGAAEGAPTVPLTRLQKGQTGRICECQLAEEDAALLRAMGLCTDARVRLCRVGEPCIVAIQCGKRASAGNVAEAASRRGNGSAEGHWTGSRIGLARSLAERILVSLE